MATTRKPGVRKAAAARRPAAEKTVRKAATKRPAAKKAARKTAAKRPAAKKATGKPRKTAPRKITPKQALANTRKLLEAKQAHDRQAPPWQQLEGPHGTVPPSGYQSAEAAARAEELHAGESRMPAIQGSIGTQDRHHQGKRDQR